MRNLKTLAIALAVAAPLLAQTASRPVIDASEYAARRA
jgi:hypothetical protein